MKRIDKESRLLTGVYAIQNTHTESVYIGYTKNSFQSRLTQHLSRLAHNILCTTPTTSDYVCVSLPQSLIDEIDKVVGTLGYTSRTEFIKDACRRYLED